VHYVVVGGAGGMGVDGAGGVVVGEANEAGGMYDTTGHIGPEVDTTGHTCAPKL